MALFEDVLNQIGPAVVEGLAQGVLRGTLCLAVAGVIALSLHKRTSPAVRHMIWTLGVVALLLNPLGMLLAPGLRILPDWSEPMRVQIVEVVAPSAAFAPPDQTPQPPSAEPSYSVPALEPSPSAGRATETSSFDGAPREAVKTSSRAPLESSAPATPPSAAPTAVPAKAPLALEPPAASSAASLAAASPAKYKSLALMLWLTGFMLCLAPVLIGYASMLAAGLKYRRVTQGPWHELLNSLRTQLRIRRPVTLIRTRRGGMPMTWGIIFPQVVLPEDSFGWSAERKRIVILHELAHIRRWDTLTQLLAQLACAFFWFNPLVWYASSRMRIERELACDDLVLRAGCRASDYAEELLSIAAGFKSGDKNRLTAALGVPMARSHKIESRVRSILDLSRRPGAITGLGLLTAIVAAAAILVPGIVLRAKSSSQPPSPGQVLAVASSWLQRSFKSEFKPVERESKGFEAPPAPAAPETLSEEALTALGRPDPGASLADPEPLPRTRAPEPVSQAVRQIQDGLSTPIGSLKITDQPLGDALQKIAEEAKVAMDVDWKAMDAAGVSRTTPIDFLGQNVTYADFLHAVLYQAGARAKVPYANRPVFLIRDTGIAVAPRRTLLANGPSRDYDLTVLLNAKDAKDQPLFTAEALVARFKETGEPGDWDAPSPDQPPFSDLRFVANRITVIAPQETHDQIRKTLSTLITTARTAQNPGNFKAITSPGVTQQPIPESIDRDPAKTLILNNAGNWSEVGWLNGAAAVSAHKSADHVWRFDVADPGGDETWLRNIAAPVFAKNYPILVVRYRATGLAPSGPYGIWMDDGVGPNMGGLTPMSTQHFIADGTLREVRTDLRLIPRAKPNTGPLAGSLALGVHAAPGKRATFEIHQVRWEADPATPNAPVVLDQAGAFYVIDDLDKPLQGVTVRAMADYENLSNTVQTDATGAATVSFARPSSISQYTRPNRDKAEQSPGMLVQLSKEGYGTRFYRVSFPLRTRTVLRFEPVAPASGRVVDGEQKPVEGAGVMIEATNAKTSNTTQRTALTDNNGQWTTDAFPVGKDWNITSVRALNLRFLSQEFLPKDQQGKLTAKDLCAQETTIVVQKGITLTGRILDPEGRNIPGATVECEYDFGTLRTRLASAPDPSTGRFAIGPIAPGQARMVFRGNGYQAISQIVSVAEKPARQNINATLLRATPIRGRLVDKHGKGISGAWVRVRISQNGPATFDGRTGPNGAFTYPNAPDKVCKVEIILEEGQPFYVVEISPDPRVQTITLHSGHATVEPLFPFAPNNTSYRIRGILPTQALTRDALESLGLRHIRTNIAASNNTPQLAPRP